MLSQLSAQQYFFKNYSVENGLPFVQVSCMYQDANGYLWSGGYGGLSRFDGKVFTNYNRKNGLIDHSVYTIFEGSKGDIFAGTNKGLSLLRGGKFINFPSFNDVAGPSVTSFCRNNNGVIYIGTNKGLFTFSNDKVRPVKELEGYRISCLLNTDSNLIFIGTDKGLIIYGPNTFKHIDQENGLVSDHVSCLARFGDNLAIGTVSGLGMMQLSTGKISSYHIENGLIDENITSLVNQHNQFLWVGSQTGLLRFDGNQFEYYNIDDDNNSNHVLSLLNDREDNIWIGTHSGLFRYRDNSFTTFDKASGNGIGSSFIYQIFRDSKDNLWVTSQNNGVFRGNGNYFKRYGPQQGLIDNTCRSGLEDRDGRVLFGTSDHVMQVTNERFRSLPLPAEFKGPYDEMYLGRGNVLWIGGSNGFAAMTWEKGTPRTKFYPIDSKSQFNVLGFCEDNYGNLYIGTYNAGLYRLTNGRLSNLSSQLSLNEENFFSLRFSKDKVFGASLNGLLVLNTKNNSLKRISNSDGLNSELVYSIEFAENKNALWIGTNQGINKLDLRLYQSTGLVSIVSYGKQEGFSGVECNSNGIWEDTDGTLWFGTVGGIVRHQPFNFKKNRVQNSMLIEQIQVLNEDTVLPDNCELPSDLNTISFRYRGICLTNPDKVLYQKKLEGLEKEWSAPSSEDYIKYTNLAPGKYTFMVRSGNNEGIWNSGITRFSFEIKRPIYLTWWFLLVSSLIAFALIYLIFMIRIINIKKQQRLDFERKVERSKIELKALRSQMNPHFIFNSLNSIQHYIFNTRSDEAIKYLNKFARLVRIILSNSEKPSVTVQEDLEALKLYLELEQMRFEDKFDYEIIIDPSVDADYDIMPPLLMQPYVENAILHGLNPKEGKGKLTITLNSKNNFLICTITDNGIGREKAAEIKRTMPFRKHKSMGMKITEDRLKILNEINNSQLSVTITDLKDANGQAMGTRVQLFVPLSG